MEIGGKGCNARGVFNELEDTGKGWKLHTVVREEREREEESLWIVEESG